MSNSSLNELFALQRGIESHLTQLDLRNSDCQTGGETVISPFITASHQFDDIAMLKNDHHTAYICIFQVILEISIRS
jgi:hypothetical protein